MQGMQTLTSADSLDSSSLKEPRVALRLSSQRVALPGCGQAAAGRRRSGPHTQPQRGCLRPCLLPSKPNEKCLH